MPVSVGYWDSCSGCTESEDGYVSTTRYPIHPKYNVPTGCGCDECKGRGVVFHPMTKAMVASIEEDGRSIAKSK